MYLIFTRGIFGHVYRLLDLPPRLSLAFWNQATHVWRMLCATFSRSVVSAAKVSDETVIIEYLLLTQYNGPQACYSERLPVGCTLPGQISS